MKIVSYFTKPYENYAMRLLASCDRLGLDADIQELPDLGGWIANVRHKPPYIQQMLGKHKDSVLWIDADSVVHSTPSLLLSNPDCDMAAYYSTPTEPMSGVIYFANTEGAKKIIKRWIAGLDKYPDRLDDDEPIQEAIKKSHEYKILHLPPSYNWMAKRMSDRFSNVKPVIEHFTIGSNERKR